MFLMNVLCCLIFAHYIEHLWSDEFLEEMRGHADPAADKVVADIFARDGVEQVNRILRCFNESDAPIPEGLPPLAREFFDATDDLPEWFDAARNRFGEISPICCEIINGGIVKW